MSHVFRQNYQGSIGQIHRQIGVFFHQFSDSGGMKDRKSNRLRRSIHPPRVAVKRESGARRAPWGLAGAHVRPAVEVGEGLLPQEIRGKETGCAWWTRKDIGFALSDHTDRKNAHVSVNHSTPRTATPWIFSSTRSPCRKRGASLKRTGNGKPPSPSSTPANSTQGRLQPLHRLGRGGVQPASAGGHPPRAGAPTGTAPTAPSGLTALAGSAAAGGRKAPRGRHVRWGLFPQS